MSRRNVIVFLIDSNLFPAAIFQAVRAAALNPRDDTDICVVTDSKRDLAVARDFAAPCRLVGLDPEALGVPPNNGYASRVSYYRAYLPELLGGEYKRMLYLDVDIAIENDTVFSLFDLEMNGYPLAAIRDSMVAYSNVPANDAELASTLRKTKDKKKYLNNGVTLIDPDRFSALKIGLRALEVICGSPHPLGYANQTAINTVLQGGWLELSPAFNMMVPLWKSFVRNVCPPAIVHFAGPVKPWHGPHFTENHPVGAEMERFFRASSWKGFLAKFFNFQDAYQRIAPLPGSQLSKPQRASMPSIEQRPQYDMAQFVRYLAETSFADAQHGLTTLDLSRVPDRFRTSKLRRT